MSPTFKHDCEQCVYLGTLHYSGTLRMPVAGAPHLSTVMEAHPEFRVFDLYFCDKQTTGPTVIARFSAHGPDYKSGLQLANGDPELRAARDLAKERKLL